MPRLPGAGTTYEAPASADLELDTQALSVDQCVQKVVDLLRQRKFIS
jgi:adenylylsulfate kinase-like enzyme